VLAGFGLLLLFGFAFSWVAACVGLVAKGAEAAQGFGLVWVFPFTFVSSAFVPAATMPAWLRGYAENSPVTVMIETLRAWFGGRAAGELALRSAAWSGALIVVFTVLAVVRLRRAGR
ncbi:MAG: ABC transporter permease, partial [Nonomuraea sp.]|nr:ABC transporter permease [Nonomuraea sp.]